MYLFLGASKPIFEKNADQFGYTLVFKGLS